MRRLAFLALLVGLVFIPTTRHLDAQTATSSSTPTITTFNGYCFSGSYSAVVNCPASPTPSVRDLIPANKSLSVGGPVPGPEGTTSYPVSITSQLACFGLNEPVNVYALSNAGAAALTQLYPVLPGYVPSNGQSITARVDQNLNTDLTGTAQLSLETDDKAVGDNGLTVKAFWPQESVERVQQVIAPVPTETATPLPGASTPTATPAPPVQSPTGTPTPTSQATPSSGALTVQACVQPPVVMGASLGGDFPVLYGLTSPGALCSADVLYSTGDAPDTFDGSPQVALSDRLVVFNYPLDLPWNEQSVSDYGIGLVTCANSTGAPVTACTAFLIAQDYSQDLLNLTGDQLRSKILALEQQNCPAGTVLS